MAPNPFEKTYDFLLRTKKYKTIFDYFENP